MKIKITKTHIGIASALLITATVVSALSFQPSKVESLESEYRDQSNFVTQKRLELNTAIRELQLIEIELSDAKANELMASENPNRGEILRLTAKAADIADKLKIQDGLNHLESLGKTTE